MVPEKSVDESWKDNVESEKEISKEEGVPEKEQGEGGEGKAGAEQGISAEEQASLDEIEVNFLNYVTSLAFQAMIFLGEIPNPMADNKIDLNLKQAKFLIDTLILLRDKTQGNLTKEEDGLLNSSVYELQLKYVERSAAGQVKN